MGPDGGVGWPFVGRDDETDRLRRDVADPEVLGVVLSGGAGAGKTRLAREVAAACAVPPLWCQAARAVAEVPFGAVVSVLGDEDATPVQAYRRLAAAVSASGGLVVVDDLPLLDARSADLFQRLAEAGKVTFLATARADDPVPRWLEWLWLDEGVSHRAVGPLTAADVGSLTGHLLGDLPAAEQEAVARAVASRSAGNALFVRELLLDAVDRRRAGLAPTPDAGVPTKLARVLDGRRRAAGPRAEAAVETVAVLGSLPLDVLIALVGRDGVTAAETAGLVAVDDERVARPTHPLHGEAALAARATSARRTLTLTVATAVLDDGRTAPAWRLAAVAALVRQGTPPGVDALTDAARTAFAALDHDLAILIARAAVDAGGPFEAHVVLGAALSGAGRADEADAALAAALAAARTDQEVARAAGRISVHQVAHGRRLAEAEALLARVEDELSDPDAIAFVRADRAKLASIRGEVVAPGPVSDSSDGPTVLNTAIAGAYLQAMAGDADGARTTIAEALPLTDEHVDLLPWARDLLGFSGTFAALVADGPVAAVADATAGLERAVGGDRSVQGTWRFLRGLAATAAGALDGAAADLDRAASDLRDHDLIGARPLALATAAWAAALGGDVESARARLDQVVDAAATDGRVRTQMAVADAWCDAVEGRRPTAVAKLLAEVERARGDGQVVAAALAVNEVARLGEARAALAAGRDLHRAAPPSWLLEVVVARARAEVERNVVALRTLARTTAPTWPAMAAELEHVLAGRLAPDDPTGAARAQLRAHRLSAALGPCRPWGLRGVRSPLTPREEDVATAAARRATNRAIAEATGVSVRTVENQLQSVYRKLGVTSRDELDQLGV